MKIELITIGSELLAGQTLNTNALFIGDQLARAGLSLGRHVSIPDVVDVIESTLHEALARTEWIIVSGGLGPTNDDVTKQAIANVFGCPIVHHEDILTDLKERYARAGRRATPFLDTQAKLPEGAEIIPNQLGSAVGFYLKSGNSTLVAVPGVPREMQPMITEHIVPRIAREAQITTRTIIWSATGVPESRLYELLLPEMERSPEIEVGFLPSEHGVRIKFLASGSGADGQLKSWTAKARPLLGETVYAESDIGLEVVLGRMMRERHLTLACAESCTGGLVSKRMTDVPGSSDYMMAGFVTYSNEAKVKLLGVDAPLIAEHGAVSEEVAQAMARGASQRGSSKCAIAVTGIAGPDGGTPEKPVGMVWIATLVEGDVNSQRLQIMGDRAMIRERAAQGALNALRLHLMRVA